MTHTERPYDDAEQFLTDLLGIGRGPNDWWREKGTYAFRGQANAAWPLLPKRFRDYSNGESVPTVAQQAAREFQETGRFFALADEHGLQIPGDSQSLRLSITEMYRPSDEWPDPQFWSLLALAQHYGFSTRFLDWSRSARVAAYFAASEAARNADRNRTDLAVWVLDLSEFNGLRAYPNGDARRRSLPFWLVTAPGYSNPNLAAQRGCFTLYRPEVQGPDLPLDTRPLDAVYSRGMAKLTLRIEEAPRLLWLLRRDGVTAASIFPGYGGVVSALEDQRLEEPVAVVTKDSDSGRVPT
jgi:hypothetical protein